MSRWPDRPYPSLTRQQQEYLVGAVLGDDSLLMNVGSRHAHLRAQQSLAHIEYLMWKYRTMESFTIRPPRPVQSMRQDRMHRGVRFHTRATPELTKYYRLCYPKGRKSVSSSWLARLTALSLTVWYMDDGTYLPGRETCTLYTGAFPTSQQRLIVRYLRDRWAVTGCELQLNRQQWCLRFTRSGTQQFLGIIERHVVAVPSMRYKLGYPEQRWKRPVQTCFDSRANAWQERDDAALRAQYRRIPTAVLAERLRRTMNAVYLRASKLGLDGWQQDRVSDGQSVYAATTESTISN